MAEWIIAGKKGEDTIAGILKRRGVDPASFSDFLETFPKETYSPMLMPDMELSVGIIRSHIASASKICVYGDYDADGVTAASLLYSALREAGAQVSYFIPSRFEGGYGLNCDAISEIADSGVKLIITVDCGSTSKAEADFAKSLGLDIIISDHHTPPAEYPDCPFINPKRTDSAYPCRDLSGCGVAFKIAQALGFSKAYLNSLTDLVAISTIADVVPLLGENRTLVKYGLNVINSGSRPGLRALISRLELNGEIGSTDIAYIIAPHINALGRMGSAALGVRLFCGEGDPDEAAASMVENNRNRKAYQEEALKLCLDDLDENALFPVVYAPAAHEGVTGIVAGSLKERLYRPVVIVSGEGEILKGTGRSIPGVNLFELLSGCEDLFTRFGGHSGACGFSMEASKLPELKRRLQEEMEKIDPELLVEKLYIEKELELGELSMKLAKDIERLAPFGEANPQPVFCIRGAKLENAKLLGKEGKHASFSISGGPRCILFGKAPEFADIIRRGKADLAGCLEVNRYNGKEYLQFNVKDIKGC